LEGAVPNVQFKDYYDVLGIDRNANEQEIRAAFRKRARELHPDVNRNDPQAAEKFKDLNEAHEVLSSADKRAMYDRFGEDWQRYKDAGVSPTDDPYARRTVTNEDFESWFTGGNGTFTFETSHPGGNGRFSDFFNLLFGNQSEAPGRTRIRQPRPQRGADSELVTTITLEEAATGTSRQVTIKAPEACPICDGTGVARGGTCPRCDGRGTIDRHKQLEVSIPKGVRTGSRVRIAGQGAPGARGGPAGDVYLVIRVLPHPRFERNGDDLLAETHVPLYMAVLGGEVVVDTLSGPVALTIPAGTQQGRLFRLRGKGMPVLGSKTDARGDLKVRVIVDIPADLSPDERDAFERLRRSREP
jgi:DnaJ-class molecular chaperone